MTPLRQRMREDMQLRGFASRTQDVYIPAVQQFVVYYHKSPEQSRRRRCGATSSTS